MSDSNWNQVQQEIIDSVAAIQKATRSAASKDLVKRLIKEGVPANKISIEPDKSIVAKAANQTEYEAGKIYFDKVMQDIEKDKDWIENL